MSLLKKIGTIILKGTQLLVGIGPFVPADKQSLYAKVSDGLAQALQVVLNVEAFGAALGTSGPDKLKAAAGPIAQIILQADLLTGRKLNQGKEADFIAACGRLGGDLADIVNCFEDKVETENVT